MFSLLLKFNHLYTTFATLTKENPVMAGAISLWGLGVVTYLAKGVPKAIWDFIVRQLTTTLTVKSSDAVYYDLLAYVSSKKLHSFVRTLSLTKTAKWSWSNEKAFVAMGYGQQWFIFSGKLMSMYRQLEHTETADNKETINLKVFGRNHKVFNELFAEIKQSKEQEKKVYVHAFKDGEWREVSSHYPRSLDTIVLRAGQKESIIAHIDTFVNNKEWCIKHGIPWKTGILLSGPPGTGKSSLMKALCAHYERNLYMLELSQVSDTTLMNALSSVPEKAIVIMEDIDVAGIPKRNDPSKVNLKDTLENAFSSLTLSGVLNAIDGPASKEGVIVIATSNNPEALDYALVRPGRFDLKVQMGYMDNDMLNTYLLRFYPDSQDTLLGWEVKENVAVCDVQSLVLQNPDNIHNVLNAIGVRVERLAV